jgi:stage III sporulation protein AG
MLKEKIKSLTQKKVGKDNKKTVENLVVFLILLIITIISINIIWGKSSKSEEKSKVDEEYRVLAQNIDNSNISQRNEYNLEKNLEEVLCKISGVGKVQVLITYSETSEIVAMKNEQKNASKTEESDSNRWNKKRRNNR